MVPIRQIVIEGPVHEVADLNPATMSTMPYKAA